ncbi:hypothetical protein DDZ15_08035 [Rhodohalobacter mucosus]|uniref:Uncharacterized protein n=1 Tax=Rhodohalobacter mucosus TaxID=2079485 RepID=A0A316TTZ1_9BACT|nr:hypothetical protein DDZ15_08035 [Rhodohalobacter mucosus]
MLALSGVEGSDERLLIYKKSMVNGQWSIDDIFDLFQIKHQPSSIVDHTSFPACRLFGEQKIP